MIPLTITFEEPAFPELGNKTFLHTVSEVKVAVLDHGMNSGQPSVAFKIDLTDAIRVGSKGEPIAVLAETSARLFCTAARMIMAMYPDLFKDN